MYKKLINASANYWKNSKIYNICLITADKLESRARANRKVKGSLQEFFHINLSPVANARRGQSKLPASHVKTVFQGAASICKPDDFRWRIGNSETQLRRGD